MKSPVKVQQESGGSLALTSAMILNLSGVVDKPDDSLVKVKQEPQPSVIGIEKYPPPGVVRSDSRQARDESTPARTSPYIFLVARFTYSWQVLTFSSWSRLRLLLEPLCRRLFRHKGRGVSQAGWRSKCCQHFRATLPNCKEKARDNQVVVLIASECLRASINSKKEKNVKMKKFTNRFGFVNRRAVFALLCFVGLVLAFFATRKAAAQGQSPGAPAVQGVYRGLSPVVKFDISPPLREMRVILPGPGELRENEDRDLLPYKVRFAPEWDPVVQATLGGRGNGSQTEIPGPIVSFNGQTNTSSVGTA